MQLLRDFRQTGGEWKGAVYVPDRDMTYRDDHDVDATLEGSGCFLGLLPVAALARIS